MSYQFQEITDEKDYQPLDIFPHTQFTQSWFYGEWQSFLGRDVRRFRVKSNGKPAAYLQAIPHPLPLGKQYLYIPFGPVFARKPTDSLLKAISVGLKDSYASENIVFARTDPDGSFDPLVGLKTHSWQPAPSFVASEASFRPRGEMIVELADEESVFASFDKNTRYSARYGGKKGVTTRVSTDLVESLEDFYRLLKFTSELQDFAIFPKAYYRHMLEVCEGIKNAYFIEAILDNHVISSKLIVTYGTVAHSLLSGTDEVGRKLRVPSLVQWEAMREAIRRNCTRYSIGGASSSEHDYPSIKKVTEYKKGFGGQVIVHSDLHDIVFNPLWYKAYSGYKSLKAKKK
jgi:lipid II:glycine glycyltransferase (peptidoglycan interpeptide bridge formation enzyme)